LCYALLVIKAFCSFYQDPPFITSITSIAFLSFVIPSSILMSSFTLSCHLVRGIVLVHLPIRLLTITSKICYHYHAIHDLLILNARPSDNTSYLVYRIEVLSWWFFVFRNSYLISVSKVRIFSKHFLLEYKKFILISLSFILFYLSIILQA